MHFHAFVNFVIQLDFRTFAASKQRPKLTSFMSYQNNSSQEKNESALKDWREREKKALELLRIVGELRFDKSVELVLFRNDLYHVRPSQVIGDHRYAQNYVNKPISLDVSLALAREINDLKALAPSKIDLGMLAIDD